MRCSKHDRRRFDISRTTGYKIFSRYKDCGIQGLTDRSRRPYRHANRLPFQIEKLIVQLKARLLFPAAELSHAKDHGRAEALLLGHWWLQHGTAPGAAA